MKIKMLFLFLASNLLLHGQSQSIRLIIRADDLGSSHSVNEAIIKSCSDGIATTVEIMAPAPWCPEAIRFLQKYPDVDVGIHLTLTSEWENIKWRPLTVSPSLVDRDGYFFPMIYPNVNYPSQSVQENKPDLNEIEKEFRAQIEYIQKQVPYVSHISSHMGCTGYAPDVRALGRRLAEEYKLMFETSDYQVTNVSYDGPGNTSEEKIRSFIKMLQKLEPGRTYLFVDHPGINDSELQAIYHIGYEGVASDRQGVTDVFTNMEVKNLIREKGIQLISYRDLAKRQ